ncbi:DUF4173 domain-containing protein [Arachidicoccus sp.]|uniref:DUF4153 domain-containing protein n=1 Tax=Arachidicoccus sp. TaxID=1872624 RepID=UPI003D1E48FB
MKPLSKFSQFIISILLYVALFYNQYLGINYSLLCLSLWLLSYSNTTHEKRSKVFWLLSLAVFISAFSFAWYGDPASFISLFISLFIMGIYTQYRQVKIITYPVLAAYSFASFIVRIFFFSKWLPHVKVNNKASKKAIAYFVIPTLLLTLFTAIYVVSNNTFSSFFTNIRFNFNVELIVFLSISGFYFMFNYWFMMPPKLMLELDGKLNNHLTYEASQQFKPTFDFLEIDFERRSGEISLVLLNLLLIVFIFTYDYEQLGNISINTNLSGELHQSINALIVSIVMAISVIMFYFKSVFNFDQKAKHLKQLAYCWIALNMLLTISAISKNTEYVFHLGLTFKRIGVYIFLLLCVIGLIFTYLKIRNKLSNYFLIGKMFVVFFITIVLNCTINWSWLITKYNLTYINHEKENYWYLKSLGFNQQLLYNHFRNDTKWKEYFENEEQDISDKQQRSFLSKSFYYEHLNLR